MTAPRLDTFRAMVAKSPTNVLARFGLANELLKAKLWEEAEEHLRVYLGSYDDEGNGYGRHAEALEALGRTTEAVAALQLGIEAAHRFGHPGLASDLHDRLAALEESA
jgi:predicted Zn-dependent protease